MNKKITGIIISSVTVLVGGCVIAFANNAKENVEINAISEMEVSTEITDTTELIQDETINISVKTDKEDVVVTDFKPAKGDDSSSATTKKETEEKSKMTSEERTEVTTESTTEARQELNTEATTEVTTEQPIQPEKEKVWVPDRYEKVWVVDEPARVDKIPIYEEVPYMQCNVCKQKMYSVSSLDAHFGLGTGPCGPASWSDGCDYNIVGYDEINVEEKGHYENKLVEPGHWE